MNDIIKRVNQVYDEQKLLGYHDFTENEFAEIVEFTGNLCRKLPSYPDHKFGITRYKVIFSTLVEIAKRWHITSDTHDNRSFWIFIYRTLTGKEENNQQLYVALTSIIAEMKERYKIPIVITGNKYYATLMMHSFAPKSSIFSFFDLCYNIFKNDLNFGFTNDDEWLCEIVAEEMKKVLGGEYNEDKKVSIGVSAYSIKIGLRSFALHEDLHEEFVKFIKDTFYQINTLFNREKINAGTRLERFVTEWWKNKTDAEEILDNKAFKKRTPTVSKQNIVIKYLRYDTKVVLSIPAIRIEDNSTMWLTVYVDDRRVYSKVMETKRGEFVVTTKPKEFELNELLKGHESINVRVEIKENENIIFNSAKNKTTVLNRAFILFEGEKEVFSQFNKPTNYFVYSKNIDGLKNTPTELQTYGTNLYSIYPADGESITGAMKQVFFINEEKATELENKACLLGNMTGVEWKADDVTCVVYDKNVRLLIPINMNLKPLELRINGNAHKLQNLDYENGDNICYQFDLSASELISERKPAVIILYSFEKETALLTQTLIVYPKLDIKFNKAVYYGGMERKVTIINDNEIIDLSWCNQDQELIYPLDEGILLIKIPYFRWRINSKEWHVEPINRKIWYKDLLDNGDLLEIDSPKDEVVISLTGETNGKSFEIKKNQNGRFEVGRAIFLNENKTDVSVHFSNSRSDMFKVFTVATMEHFTDNPLLYANGRVYWNVEDAFVGDRNNDFFLIAKTDDNIVRTPAGSQNFEFENFKDGYYEIEVKMKDKNIFSQEGKYDTILKSHFIVGKPEKFRFKRKILHITHISADFTDMNVWRQPGVMYVISDLTCFEESTAEYYTGTLGLIKDGRIIKIKSMINENGEEDLINPVRIDLRSNNSFWLLAGYNDDNDFLGELIFDNEHRKLCNINSSDSRRYVVVNLYKFKEEAYV